MKWEEPKPALKPGEIDWTPITNELRQHPKRWALVVDLSDPAGPQLSKSSVRTYSRYISSGHSPAFEPAGSFEAASRDGGTKLYIRYIGEVQS